MTISNTKWLFFLAEHTFTSLGYRAFIHLKKKKKKSSETRNASPCDRLCHNQKSLSSFAGRECQNFSTAPRLSANVSQGLSEFVCQRSAKQLIFQKMSPLEGSCPLCHDYWRTDVAHRCLLLPLRLEFLQGQCVETVEEQ